MQTNTHNLQSIYRGWDLQQRRMLRLLKSLSDDQLHLRPATNLRSVGELLAHIIAVRARWFHFIFHEGGEAFVELGNWDRPDAPERDITDLTTGLETTWHTIWDALGRWTIADLDETFEDEEDGEHVTYTRQWVLWHLLEHDIHHGGELSYTLGIYGMDGLNFDTMDVQ
ncbi:putative damage-inducible protein DinB [Thermosporothrix hazakensis]|jgi:uncharacterized damage-inducible protein DinB|uniref:Damage-inducible protein DinB n=2 Tax=Thermosporothrix TaxID=768650 RepID=A0A455SLD3_9CHLR|nr:DinB family protein [Thermosporothrix hazakensis]PZW21045.1 putative damage-inducible protein DinB [Thermosporothrix hazakensis]BBH88178.1 hypothetical protein KTC_29290 [Thermosporothrix sp. COM3]GCE46367.1 hypothetical protein KTH_12360 [Thermosporothrix hazakensis]